MTDQWHPAPDCDLAGVSSLPDKWPNLSAHACAGWFGQFRAGRRAAGTGSGPDADRGRLLTVHPSADRMIGAALCSRP